MYRGIKEDPLFIQFSKAEKERVQTLISNISTITTPKKLWNISNYAWTVLGDDQDAFNKEEYYDISRKIMGAQSDFIINNTKSFIQYEYTKLKPNYPHSNTQELIFYFEHILEFNNTEINPEEEKIIQDKIKTLEEINTRIETLKQKKQ